ncbi:MAG: UDP-N-acetylmuramoyl-tripeptide--D-alanyl-D-alanine ligase [Lachnospiraceae bacterium]|nr:UDP-N-acetylmuramoyl-tripeptide--D-alanyl-D-alanine ligase [Lachnospiraceae bacterium]
MESFIFERLYNPVNMSIIGAILMILIMLKQIHIMQLNSYNLDQQIIWYKKNTKLLAMHYVLFFSTIILPLIIAIAAFDMRKIVSLAGMLLLLIFYPILLLIILIENLPRKQKKKLIFTNRIKRLIVINILVYGFWFLLSFRSGDILVIVLFALMGVALCPLLNFVSFLISLPIENALRHKFMNEARDILVKHDDLYVIGITGSFGKTSVKYYLNSLLKNKYSVCMTPESFNTPMGATLTIKNDLRNIDDIFICEMGARRIGDIKEICDIVSPSACIITDVGDMHLDTFKNIENVKNTKFELFDSVIGSDKVISKFDKIILLNGDNELIRNKVSEYDISNKNIYFYGLDSDNDFYAKDISHNEDFMSFTLTSKNNLFSDVTFETRLLGKYSIKNLVASISFAMLLGVDEGSMKKTVANILPVPHRLQLLSNDKNNLIIDDAYNSNLNGAKNAVDALGTFKDYVKVIITPGMVELGDKQWYENNVFAEYASSLVDYAIVVGNTNRDALKTGFEKNLNSENVILIDKVEEAIFYARNNISGKKVILLENDLSDNY